MAEKAFNWSEDFFRPLVSGGTCFVGNPLGLNFVKQSLRMTHEPVFEEVRPILLRAYAKWLPQAPVNFDNSFGLLTAALYELCATAHPQTDAFYAQAHDFAAHARNQIQNLNVPQTASALVVRHLAVAPMLSLTRKAVEVQWWSGQKTFYGEQPQLHLLWLPKLRRVRLEEKNQPFWLAAWRSGDEVNRNSRRKLLKTLLSQSPLTMMLAVVCDLPLTRFDMNPLLRSGARGHAEGFLLWEHPTLARGVMDWWLSQNPQKASDTLAFWFLNSLERQRVHRVSQRRCLEILMYLLWSTLVFKSPHQERLVIWEKDFWDTDPEQWPESRLLKWGLIQWALNHPSLNPPFSQLPSEEQKLFAQLLDRLKHPEIQSRITDRENQFTAVWPV